MSMKTALRPRVWNQGTSNHQDAVKADASSFGQAPEDRTGRSYNEAAFRHFLTLERNRSERAGRSLLLVLVELEPRSGTALEGRFEPRLASKLFDVLWSKLRDTDCLGWYREGHIVGALLTDQFYAAGTDIEQVIDNRIGQTVRKALRREGAPRVHVRVHKVAPMTTRVGPPWR
jgi:hypothetical protein